MIRVLPRDAFNDADLLKCIGKIVLLIEDRAEAVKGLTYEYDGEPFDIVMNEYDGSISVANVQFSLNGKPVRMFRPLNTRAPWPLIMDLGNGDTFYMFHVDGTVAPISEALNTEG